MRDGGLRAVDDKARYYRVPGLLFRSRYAGSVTGSVIPTKSNTLRRLEIASV